jgi:hypothetical protein
MFSLAPTILSDSAAPISPAVAIIAAILTAGGSLSSPEQAALTTYVDTLVAAGIWSKRILLYGIMGGTDASHAINWANLGVNTLSYAGNFPTSTSNGIQFNGGYAATGYFASAGNFALTTYSRDTDARLGTIDTGPSAPRFYSGQTTTVNFNAVNSTFENYPTFTVPVKHVINQRANSTTLKSYAEGALISTITDSAVVASSEVLIAILRSAGTPAFPQGSSSVCQHYGIWQALSDAEALALYNAELTLQTVLGRN